MQTTAPRPGSRRGRVSRDALPSASAATASPLQAQGARPMTVGAMRAAVIAIRAGVFDDVSDGDLVREDQASSAAVTGIACQPDRDHLHWTRADVGGPVVLAVAGHAGAGASTVALAVPEGAAGGPPVGPGGLPRPRAVGWWGGPVHQYGAELGRGGG